MTLKDYFELVDYRVTEGGKYLWSLFGPHAYGLAAWDDENESISASVVFDTKKQTVYQMEVFDYATERAFRWTNPDYAQQFITECEQRDAAMEIAYDDVRMTDVADKDEFLKFAREIYKK